MFRSSFSTCRVSFEGWRILHANRREKPHRRTQPVAFRASGLGYPAPYGDIHAPPAGRHRPRFRGPHPDRKAGRGLRRRLRHLALGARLGEGRGDPVLRGLPVPGVRAAGPHAHRDRVAPGRRRAVGVQRPAPSLPGYGAAQVAAIPRLAGLLGAGAYVATNASGSMDLAAPPAASSWSATTSTSRAPVR